MEQQFLPQINSPSDLRDFELSELKVLAQEIRDVIVETVSKNGGHLAPCLGVVELTIALHYVFYTPNDKIVWDVGHQAYAHKLLTGRREAFSTLRQLGGISGFPRRKESVYDTFDVGHSSTSISAALGMAEAISYLGDKEKVVAVIGDGSLTAGIAFEGLNHAGSMERDLIVVLNDNEMSISSNVGALSAYLNRILTGQLYTRIRNEMKSVLGTLPAVGGPFSRVTRKVEEFIKGLLTPGMLFEELGFNYVGPLDGHRLGHLIDTFKNIRELKGPVLVHAVTKKGKGYLPAEEQPTKYHGLGPFDPETGETAPSKGPSSYTSVFGKTLQHLARKDDKIFTITAAMPQGTGLEAFSKEFPNRFHDVGIAEQHCVTFAAGLACKGLKPVVAIYSTFLQRAFDQVLHDVCLPGLPVVFALDRAGLVGEDGPTHHGVFDLSFLRSVPNLIIMAPKDERELQQMLASAVEFGRPCVIRYPRGAGIGVPVFDEEIPILEIGRSEILREGNDLLILAVGSMVHPTLEAAEILVQNGIEPTVINARFVKPLDEEGILQSAKKIGRVLTVEENALAGGFGAAVIEMLHDSPDGCGNIAVKRMGIPDSFVEHGPQKVLRSKHGLDAAGIAAQALRFMDRPALYSTNRKESIV